VALLLPWSRSPAGRQTHGRRPHCWDPDLQAKHAQGLLERALQTLIAEVVGADETVTVPKEHPDAGTETEGWAHARDPVLFGQHPR
jgi:hypothetical protein